MLDKTIVDRFFLHRRRLCKTHAGRTGALLVNSETHCVPGSIWHYRRTGISDVACII